VPADERIHSLLAVVQLANVLASRPRLAPVLCLGEDHAAVQDSAYQQAADRVAGKERVEKACHPHFIPSDVTLDEGELPWICS
jgi:hypothetical protein